MDDCPCNSCPAKDKFWAVQRCYEMGACWVADPDILEEVLSSVGVEAWQLHYPPVFTVRMKRFGDKHIMDGFAAEQKLNRMGKLVRSMYEIAVTSRRRERLRRIGFNRK